jgi:hypothetical protein
VPKDIEGKEMVEEKPKVIEIRKGATAEKEPRVVEVKKESEPKVIEIKEKGSGEELKLEEEEFEEESEAEVEVEKGPETIAEPIEKEMVEEPVEEVKIAEEEKAEMVEEEVLLEEPEPVPKGPPIPSTLPYRVKPAALPSRAHRQVRTVPLVKRGTENCGWWMSGKVGTEITRRGSTHPRRRAGQSGAPA